MTPEELQLIARARAAISEHDRQLLEVVDQTYRHLEKAYHNSDTYQAMVRQYPELQRSIARCERGDLVGGVPRDPVRPRSQAT